MVQYSFWELTMQEIWKDVVGYEGCYAVSNFGNVKALCKIDKQGHFRKERLLILARTKDGYLRTHFSNGKNQKHYLVHRLVQITFNSSIPENYEVNHKNGIRHDNRPENLEAISHTENVRYSKDKLGANYATYGNGRMTKEQREQIFELRKNGLQFEKIGKILGFSKTQVRNVWYGKCWNVHGLTPP